MECPICYNIIINSAIGSCTHHFCKACLIRWCEFGGTKCPTCNALITHIRVDPEFDQINGTTHMNSNYTDQNKVVVNFEKDDHAGITLENNYSYMGLGERGPGVIISKINEKYKCYKNGLRKGDIVLSINNIPCVNHYQSVDIINNCVMNSTKMTCSMLKMRKI